MIEVTITMIFDLIVSYSIWPLKSTQCHDVLLFMNGFSLTNMHYFRYIIINDVLFYK